MPDNPAPRREPDDNPYWAEWDERPRPRARKIPLEKRVLSAVFLAFGIVFNVVAVWQMAEGPIKDAFALGGVSATFYAACWLMKRSWPGEPINR